MKNRSVMFYALTLVIVISILFILILVFSPLKKETNNINTGTDEVIPYEKMKNNETYSQKIKCTLESTKKLSLKFSTFGAKNDKGILNLKLYSEDGNLIKNNDVTLSDIDDNSYYNIVSNEALCQKNEYVILDMSYSEYYKNNSLTFWFTYDNIDEALKINDKSTDKKLQVITYGKKKSYNLLWYPIMAILISLSGLVIEGGSYEKQKN